MFTNWLRQIAGRKSARYRVFWIGIDLAALSVAIGVLLVRGHVTAGDSAPVTGRKHTETSALLVNFALVAVPFAFLADCLVNSAALWAGKGDRENAI